MPNGDDRFLNQYNFIKVPEFTPHYEFQKRDSFKGHSGYIDVTMKTTTPLFTAGEMTEEDIIDTEGKTFKHRVLDFFKINEKPCIPSTSLKGMLRSTIETLSNSCFRIDYTKNEKMNYLSHRLDVENTEQSREIRYLKAGVLKKTDNGWHFIQLEEAKVLSTSASNRYNDGELYEVRTNNNLEKLSVEAGADKYIRAKRRGNVNQVNQFNWRNYSVDSVNGNQVDRTSTNKTFPYVNLPVLPSKVYGIVRKLDEIRQFGRRQGSVRLFKLKELSENVEQLANRLQIYQNGVEAEKCKKREDHNLIRINELSYSICEVVVKTSHDIDTKTQDKVFFQYGNQDLDGYINAQTGIQISEDVIKKFKNVIATRYDELKKRYKDDTTFKLQPKGIKDGMLVFAKFQQNNNNNIDYLSYTQIPRKPFKYGIADIIARMNKTPCSGTNSLCPACNLFGFVNGKQSLAGKLSFSMGKITGGKLDAR